MKKIILSLAVLALSLFVAKPAFAQDAVSVDFNGAIFPSTNIGSVCNFSTASGNSGYNTVDNGATVTTKSSDADTLATTKLNSTDLSGGIVDTASGPIAVNEKIKEGDVLALAIDANLVGVLNFNYGHVGNNSFAMSNSGFNYGGKKSTISTGAADSDTSTETTLNSNKTDVTIENTSEEGPIAFNKKVDDGVAVAVNANGVLVMDTNMGGVCNFSVAGANSGLNYSDNKSDITTKTATASTGTTTDLNENDTTVEIKNSSSPVAANVKLGEDEEGLAVAVNANVALVDNNNLGGVTNFSMAGANTGLNESGKKSSIGTGVAKAETSTSTTLNSNTTTITIADNTNGPVAVNTDKKGVNPCNPEIPNPCTDTGCPNYTNDSIGTNGPVAANIKTDGGTAIAVNANVASVNNDNEGTVTNISSAVANSGANDTGKKSTVTTGAALATTGVTSDVNNNETHVVITDGASTGPVAANEKTDGGTAVAVDANAIVVSNDNEAKVTNVSNASANTGANGGESTKAACEPGCDDGNANGGSVTTGAATASTTTTNTVNTNTTTFTINH